MVAALAQLFREGSASVLLIPVEIAIVSCVSLILHSELYQQRPQTTLLTNFYVWVAFGGFLGGLLNGLLAPAVFPGIIEYPLILGLGILIIEWPLLGQAAEIYREQTWNGIRLIEVVVAGTLSLLFAVLLVGTEDLTTAAIVAVLLLITFMACMFAVGASKGGRFCIGLGFLIYLGISVAAELDRGVHSGRTFFGAFRVDDFIAEDVEYRRFRHGTTLHGLQAIDSDLELTVQSYYPAIVDYVWPHYNSQDPLSIAVTGLGAGVLACLAREGDRVTFFEIDPVVEDVAREYFTYLEKCPPSTKVILGDARLSLATIEDNAYDLLILDAFSSDSVPIHLLTNEAAAAYDRVLKENGLLVIHITNRYIDLRPVLAQLAKHHSWSAWEIATEQRPDRPLERDAIFVVISRDDLVDRLLDGVSGAKSLEATPEFKLWTDDYASLLSVVRYRTK